MSQFGSANHLSQFGTVERESFESVRERESFESVRERESFESVRDRGVPPPPPCTPLTVRITAVLLSAGGAERSVRSHDAGPAVT